MTRQMINTLMMIGVMGITSFAWNEAVKAMTGPLNQGVNPTAMLLLDQGIKQYGEGERSAAQSSFELASQIDPKISLPTFGDVSPAGLSQIDPRISLSTLSAGNLAGSVDESGFFEYGLISILGFLFVLAIAAHEIGTTQPPMEPRNESFEPKEYFDDKWWPKAA